MMPFFIRHISGILSESESVVEMCGTIVLKKEYIELHNLLKVTGLCESGGQAGFFIREGKVRVDGQVELRKACKIRAGQTVAFDGQEILVRSPK